MRRLLQWIFIAISILLGSLLIIAISLQFFFPKIETYHSTIERKISNALQENVSIQHLSLEYHGLQPILTLKNINIADQQNNQLMFIEKMHVGVNLFKSLLLWKLEPQDLVVQGTQLNLREDANEILHINDIKSLEANLRSKKNEKLEELLHWFLTSGNKQLSQIKINWISKNNIVLPIYIENLTGDSRFLLHQYHGKVILDNTSSSSFEAQIIGLASLQHWLKGRIDFVVNQLPISKTINLFQPKSATQILGNINLISQVSWGPTKFIHLNNYLEGNDISVITANQKTLNINNVRGNLLWQLTQHGWAMNFDDMQVQLNNEMLPFHKGKIIVQNSPEAQNIQSFKLDILPLKKITDLLINYDFVPKTFAEEWLHFNPQGQIHNFIFNHYGPMTNLKQFELSGQLENVSFSQWQAFPGIKNLSGYLNFNPRSGYLKIDSNNFGFYYPKLFRENLVADRVKTTVNWQQSNTKWHIWLKQLNIENQDGNAFGKTKLTFSTHGESVIQSKIQFHVNNLHHASKYLPVGIMPKSLVEWLDKAFNEGKLTNGEMILEGALKDFPFINKLGKFVVQAEMHNVSLHYLAEWPTITGINGVVRFDKESLSAKANAAQIVGARLNNVFASIPDLRHAKLFLRGKASSGSSNESLINQQNFSKLTKKLGDINLRGMWQLGLKMMIPIDTINKDSLQLLGSVHLKNAHIASAKIPLDLNDITGDINFTEKNVSSNQLVSKLFNQDFYFNLATDKDNKQIQMKFNGRIASQDLNTKFNLPILKNIFGATNFNGLLEFNHERDGIASSLLIHSDLAGINVNLPKPFDKKEDSLQPSSVNIKFHANKQSTINFYYGDQLSGIFNFNADNKNIFNFDRGSLLLGKQKNTLPLEKGLRLEGELPEFNLSQWRTFLNQNDFNKEQKSFDFSSLISRIHLTVNKLSLDQFQLENAKIAAETANKNWKVVIDSPKLQGQVIIPNTFPKSPIQAKLASLILDDLKTNSNTKPGDIPPLDLTVDNLKIKEKTLKNFQLKVVPEGKQLWIKQIMIKEPLFNLNASGWWRELGNHIQNTSLQGEMKSSNIGAVLNQLQITDNMVQGMGNIQFNLSWQNSPISPKVSTMNGQVGLQFKSGRIIHLTQQASMGLGIGRVLNLLSLQTLPRRLIGDFSDITSPGFPYDEMKGSFTLKNGNAYTDDAYLEGPLAKVRVQGKIGLENKDYNLRLIITPNVTSSLPLVATITAGPIAGAITWAADKILSRQVKKITEIHYNVTGTWSKPNLVQM